MADFFLNNELFHTISPLVAHVKGAWEDTKNMDPDMSMALMLVCSVGFGALIIIVLALRDKLSSLANSSNDANVGNDSVSTVSTAQTSVNAVSVAISPSSGISGSSGLGGGPLVVAGEKIVNVEVKGFDTCKEPNGNTFTA
jgi:hypothetical protein